MVHSLTSFSERSTLLANAIKVWLLSKEQETGSNRTEEIYEKFIMSFREQLQKSGYDLDGLPLTLNRLATKEDQEDALSVLSLAAQGWAMQSKRRETIGASTYNQRLSVLSSFYTFARKRRFLIMDNPIDLLDRRDIQEYANAQPLSKEEVIEILNRIDRSVLAGKRDYALLLILITTGRRASEILSLQWKHVHILGDQVTLHFEHCKGNKDMYDQLEPRVARPFLAYIRTMFMHDLAQMESEQYIWISLSMKRFKQPLTQRGLADIFQNRLGTMKVHTTRHTFAHNSAKSGDSVTNIQSRLGHSSVATTGRYLKQLDSASNEHVSKLLDYYEIE